MAPSLERFFKSIWKTDNRGALPRLGWVSKKDDDYDDVPRYPPFARGFPVVPPERLLEDQRDILAKIERALGMTDSDYERLVKPVLYKFAEYVHLLPASEHHHHRGAGGLLRHSLEVAFFATRSSEGVIFEQDNTPGGITQGEPRWRMAAFLSGLLHDSGKPITDLSVVDKDGHHEWDIFTKKTLYQWAQENKIDRYFLRWERNRHKRHERMATYAIGKLMSDEMIAYLRSGGKEINQALMDAVTGLSVSTPLSKLMLRADSASVEMDLREQYIDRVDKNAVGVAVERYLVSAMRALIASGEWKANEPGSLIWIGEDAAYVNWRKAASDVTRRLQKDNVPGIPQSPDTLAEILLDRGLAIGQPIANAAHDTGSASEVVDEHTGEVLMQEGEGEEKVLPYWYVQITNIQMAIGAGKASFMGLKLPLDILYSTDMPPKPYDDLNIITDKDRVREAQKAAKAEASRDTTDSVEPPNGAEVEGSAEVPAEVDEAADSGDKPVPAPPASDTGDTTTEKTGSSNTPNLDDAEASFGKVGRLKRKAAAPGTTKEPSESKPDNAATTPLLAPENEEASADDPYAGITGLDTFGAAFSAPEAPKEKAPVQSKSPSDDDPNGKNGVTKPVVTAPAPEPAPEPAPSPKESDNAPISEEPLSPDADPYAGLEGMATFAAPFGAPGEPKNKAADAGDAGDSDVSNAETDEPSTEEDQPLKSPSAASAPTPPPEPVAEPENVSRSEPISAKDSRKSALADGHLAGAKVTGATASPFGNADMGYLKKEHSPLLSPVADSSLGKSAIPNGSDADMGGKAVASDSAMRMGSPFDSASEDLAQVKRRRTTPASRSEKPSAKKAHDDKALKKPTPAAGSAVSQPPEERKSPRDKVVAASASAGKEAYSTVIAQYKRLLEQQPLAALTQAAFVKDDNVFVWPVKIAPLLSIPSAELVPRLKEIEAIDSRINPRIGKKVQVFGELAPFLRRLLSSSESSRQHDGSSHQVPFKVKRVPAPSTENPPVTPPDRVAQLIAASEAVSKASTPGPDRADIGAKEPFDPDSVDPREVNSLVIRVLDEVVSNVIKGEGRWLYGERREELGGWSITTYFASLIVKEYPEVNKLALRKTASFTRPCRSVKNPEYMSFIYKDRFYVISTTKNPSDVVRK